MPKNVEGVLFGICQHPLVVKCQKIEGGPFGDIKHFPKKVLQCRKKLEGYTFVSTGFVCYAEKKGKTVIVQFPGPNGPN